MKTLWKSLLNRVIAVLIGGAIVLGFNGVAQGGPLQERLNQFPSWVAPPILQSVQGDLHYPDWFAGEWQVTSTLIDLAAPFAPEVVTPGFEANQKTLKQPATFPVRFSVESMGRSLLPRSPFPVGPLVSSPQKIVADRAYNGMSLAAALLGNDVLQDIRIDPRSPNHQVARFRNGQQLVTRISDRGIETLSQDDFVTSELYQQEFRNQTQLFFNKVENTIAYRRTSVHPTQIEADQVTAIYLSPQDPQYFQTRDRPVALYRYRLVFEPLQFPSDQSLGSSDEISAAID